MLLPSRKHKYLPMMKTISKWMLPQVNFTPIVKVLLASVVRNKRAFKWLHGRISQAWASSEIQNKGANLAGQSVMRVVMSLQESPVREI